MKATYGNRVYDRMMDGYYKTVSEKAHSFRCGMRAIKILFDVCKADSAIAVDTRTMD